MLFGPCNVLQLSNLTFYICLIMSDRADKSKPHGATCQHKYIVILLLLLWVCYVESCSILAFGSLAGQMDYEMDPSSPPPSPNEWLHRIFLRSVWRHGVWEYYVNLDFPVCQSCLCCMFIFSIHVQSLQMSS